MTEYKGHVITVTTDIDGSWVYRVRGCKINETKTFSAISSNNRTIEKWMRDIDEIEKKEGFSFEEFSKFLDNKGVV